MRSLQFLTYPSQFWSTSETAGPTAWDVLRFWDTPRVLRPIGRSRPPPFAPWAHPESVGAEHATEMATFWTHHYNGTDWIFRPDPAWVATQLGTPNTLALIVREGEEIVGSIVCRGLVGEGGSFRLGILELPQAYIIEGLCIHPRWRGRHLAGWLIAWIDHRMNAKAPQVFFWSREASPRDITYVASHTYAYLPISGTASVRTDSNKAPVPIPWSEFQRAWTSNIPRWNTMDTAAFPTVLPLDPLRVWRIGRVYVAVSDTQRWTRQGGRIWEVQFCGDVEDPLSGLKEARDMLEAVGAALAAEGPGLLFVSSAPWQGGCTTWPRPWIVGTAGCHTTYIYNYMPPVFHRLATFFLRNEL